MEGRSGDRRERGRVNILTGPGACVVLGSQPVLYPCRECQMSCHIR